MALAIAQAGTACDFFLGTHFDDARLSESPLPDDPALPKDRDGETDGAGSKFPTPKDSGTSDSKVDTTPSFPVAIGGHGWHTCALTQKGELYCWGSFRSNDDIDVPWQRPKPEKVPIAGRVTSFAVGEGHNCATTEEGKTYCWGRNGFGQLGNGSKLMSLEPVLVELDGRAQTVAVGQRHSCALMTDGGIKCWGFYQTVGVDGVHDVTSPVEVPNVVGTTILATADRHTCAWSAPGKMKCWGDNEWGQLGDGTTVNRRLAVDASPPSGTVTRALGNRKTTFAILDDGSLFLWGMDFPSGAPPRVTPILVPDAPALIDIAAADGHACAVTKDRHVACWGRDTARQVGTTLPLGTVVTTPAVVPGIKDEIDSVAVGRYHSCALTRTKRLYCWGANDSDQIGTGDAGAPIAIPTEVHFQ